MGFEDESAPPKARMLSESGWRQVNEMSPDSIPSTPMPLAELQALPSSASNPKTVVAVVLAAAILVGAAFVLGRSTPTDPAGSASTPQASPLPQRPVQVTPKPVEPAKPAETELAKPVEPPQPEAAEATEPAKARDPKPRPRPAAKPKPHDPEPAKAKPSGPSDIKLER